MSYLFSYLVSFCCGVVDALASSRFSPLASSRVSSRVSPLVN